jgi:hypothetical protein
MKRAYDKTCESDVTTIDPLRLLRTKAISAATKPAPGGAQTS